MRWRDIRFEKPTAADANEDGEILQMLICGGVSAYHYDGLSGCVAWMPLSELPAFDRVPDPPEGWRFVQKGESFDGRAKFWHSHSESFVESQMTYYIDTNAYIVPVDPPKPKYRPFANAAEFAPHRDKWVAREHTDERYEYRIACIRQSGVALGVGDEAVLHSWCELFSFFTFADDGSPCGIEVSE